MAEISRQEAVRYLLGDATDAEKEVLERRFFEDALASEEIAAVEDELVDDYVAGRLAGAERIRFEQVYLTTRDRAAKIEFARALQERLAAPPKGAATAQWPRLLALAATVLVAFAGAYFAYRFNEARRELARIQEQQASLERRQKELSQLATTQAERARLEKELELTRKEAESYASQIAAAQRDVGETIAFTLAGGLTRDTSASQKTLEIPPGTKQVRLSMPLPADHYASYSAVIRTPEGREVWKATALAARRIGPRSRSISPFLPDCSPQATTSWR